MENPLSETVDAAKEGVSSIKDAAKDTLGNAMNTAAYARDEIGNKGSKVFSTILKGVTTAMSIGTLVRRFDFDYSAPVLRWLGLSRRRSMLGSFAIFGAGVVAGAGAAMLLSPTSGEEARQRLLRGVRVAGMKGQELLKAAQSQIGSLTQGERESNGVKPDAQRGEQSKAQSKAGEQSKAEGTTGGSKQTATSGSDGHKPASYTGDGAYKPSFGASDGTPPNANRPGNEANKPHRTP